MVVRGSSKNLHRVAPCTVHGQSSDGGSTSTSRSPCAITSTSYELWADAIAADGTVIFPGPLALNGFPNTYTGRLFTSDGAALFRHTATWQDGIKIG